MNLRDKLFIYIYKKGDELEREEENIKAQCRFAPLDSLDHFELMNAKMRITTFKEFLNDLYKILINCR